MKLLINQAELSNLKSRNTAPLSCYNCGNTFYVLVKTIRRAMKGNFGEECKYCSRKCCTDSKIKPGRKTINCIQCNKEITRSGRSINKFKKSFCSHNCRAIYYNTHKTVGTRVSKLEKWIQIQLPILYPDFIFKFNEKSEINSELDIYIPHLKLAIELNGIFHYEPIFGKEQLLSIQNNDNRKFQACLERNIELAIIDTSEMKNFKEDKAHKYLNFIKEIIKLSINKWGG